MPITYLAEIESVSEVRARVNLLRQVIHEEVQEERVGSVYSIRTRSPNESFRRA